MLQLKLYKQLYFLALLASLISFSGIENTIPIEKTTIEVVHIKTSNRQKDYNYEDGLIKEKRTKSPDCIYKFNWLLNHQHRLQVLNYHCFIEKYIPLQKVKLFLKSQYYSSFMNVESFA